MKQVWAQLLCIALISGIASAGEKLELKNENDKTSYSVGYQVGGDFKRQGVELNPGALVKGVQDALGGEKPLMTPEEMNQTLVDLKRRIMATEQERLKKMAEKNLADGEAFRAENGKKEGVKTLPSGLQYRVIQGGSGKTPKAGDTVRVNYRGTLIAGTEFDSSYKRGQPASFQVNGVIKGWTEALQLMKEGSKWQLVIPPELAYGERGAGAMIPPNSTLIFEVELLSVGDGS
jgi:FKBP-type peptidyl-prolyl cis-trans isomerase FklB